ncbi:hypothetical protein BDZ97DRAFT_1923462 [Flammula alnicola]|nr:hypothetical protein BDZ97DRAFT_1923462 [Flammula alnicola]
MSPPHSSPPASIIAAPAPAPTPVTKKLAKSKLGFGKNNSDNANTPVGKISPVEESASPPTSLDLLYSQAMAAICSSSSYRGSGRMKSERHKSSVQLYPTKHDLPPSLHTTGHVRPTLSKIDQTCAVSVPATMKRDTTTTYHNHNTLSPRRCALARLEAAKRSINTVSAPLYPTYQ